MTSVKPVAAAQPENFKSTTNATVSPATAASTPVKTESKPVVIKTALPDTVRLSFPSQARLLKQEGLNTEQIALRLGVTQGQVLEVLTEGQLASVLTSVL